MRRPSRGTSSPTSVLSFGSGSVRNQQLWSGGGYYHGILPTPCSSEPSELRRTAPSYIPHSSLDEFIAMHQPATAAEQDLLDQMVAARWRVRRAWTMEIGLLDCEMARRES